MSQKRFLTFIEIREMLTATWSTLDPGMVEIIAYELHSSGMDSRQISAAIRQVAMASQFKPSLKSFKDVIPRKRKNNRNLSCFGLNFPSGEIYDLFGKAYQKADWAGCVDVLCMTDWPGQEALAKLTIKQLCNMENEKQKRGLWK